VWVKHRRSPFYRQCGAMKGAPGGLIILLGLILVICEAPSVHASDRSGNLKVGISFGAGVDIDRKSISFARGYPDKRVKTSPAFGAGLSVGVPFYFGNLVELSVEVLATEFETDESIASSGGKAKYEGSLVPVVLWVGLNHEGVFGPYIKGGIGVVHTAFAKNFDSRPLDNSNYDFWSFAYGLGGGIRYSPRPSVEFLLAFEGVVGTESREFITEAGQKKESDSPFGATFWGVKVKYWFGEGGQF